MVSRRPSSVWSSAMTPSRDFDGNGSAKAVMSSFGRAAVGGGFVMTTSSTEIGVRDSGASSSGMVAREAGSWARWASISGHVMALLAVSRADMAAVHSSRRLSASCPR
ncbi:MAG: hypothetical protein L6Q76_37350, partial [Polyangiaceae bacterium]|nr:hypothetical protein [Polyangiaceae bacterium]